MVNWCELTTTDQDGKILYQKAFVTNFAVNDQNVVEIVAAGAVGGKSKMKTTTR